MALLARRGAALIADFVDWWLGELRALVPGALRRRLTSSRQRVVLALDADAAILQVETNGAREPLGRLSLADEALASGALAALLEANGLASRLRDGSAEASLRLPAERSLNTVMRLPLAAKSNLDEVVEFELDRYTPFRPEQVLFAARIVGEDAQVGLIDVDVVMVPRSMADQAVGAAQRLGFSPTRIDVGGADGGEPITDNLLRTDRDRVWWRPDRNVVTALAVVAMVLAIVAIDLPIVLAQRVEQGLSERFAAVKQQALETAALKKKIDTLRRTELFLVDRRRTTPTTSQLLFDTTHVLPDDTSLISWQVTGDELQLQGVTQSAAALVGVLEHSKIFERSNFKSPVTQEQKGGERFNIATHVAARSGS